MHLHQVLARLVTHFTEGHQGFRGELRRGDAVDDVDHRDALGADFFDELVQARLRDGADDHGIGALRDAVLDLTDLLREVGVAACLDELHLDPEPARLGDHAVVDRRPVGILHVGEGHAQVPLLGRVLERRVLVLDLLALHVEGRIPILDGERPPLLFLGRGQTDRPERDRNQDHPRGECAVTSHAHLHVSRRASSCALHAEYRAAHPASAIRGSARRSRRRVPRCPSERGRRVDPEQALKMLRSGPIIACTCSANSVRDV